MKIFYPYLLIGFFLQFQNFLTAQPNWPAIKANATFIVSDTNYSSPVIQSINVGGWEDGLFITRDGKHLFSTYMPIDVFSWLGDFSPCINFLPYFRPPLLGMDTITNNYSCPNYIHSDIIKSSRSNTTSAFIPWSSSNLQTSFSFEGGAHGILLNSDTFDVFVYTKDAGTSQGMDIYFKKKLPINPSTASAVPILSTSANEDNPHIERLNDSTLLLFFDRSGYIYYSLSFSDGITWSPPIIITNVLNDQAPYDVQPHLWHDGNTWWVYFCADNSSGKRSIYKSKQQIQNNWNSWGPKQLVIEPGLINGGHGIIYGVGEPTLTQGGDISFVVVYGNPMNGDSTDVFDCDPWFLPRKNSTFSTGTHNHEQNTVLDIFPNPAQETIVIIFPSNHNENDFVQFYNSQGYMVAEYSIVYTTKINISELLPGLYFVKLKNAPTVKTKFLKN